MMHVLSRQRGTLISPCLHGHVDVPGSVGRERAPGPLIAVININLNIKICGSLASPPPGRPPPAHTCAVCTPVAVAPCVWRGAGEPADTMKMSPLDVGPLGRPLNLDTSTSTDASNLLIVAKLRRSLDASRASSFAFGGRGRRRAAGRRCYVVIP